MGLAGAREKALEARRQIKEGRYPLAERSRTPDMTFRHAAEALIDRRRAGWRNAKHAAQWSATLASYVFPEIGERHPKAVDTAAVLTVLQPIRTTKPETASRVRQRIEAVLDYAGAIGVRSGDNPARWRGHLDHLLPQPTKVRKVRHHGALPWPKAPALMVELAQRSGTSARALRFAIPSAARSGEVRVMTWAEIDLERVIWISPPERNKAGKEQRIPLTLRASEVVGAAGCATTARRSMAEPRVVPATP